MHCSRKAIPVLPLLQEICGHLNSRPHWVPSFSKSLREKSQSFSSWDKFVHYILNRISEGKLTSVFMYGPGDLEVHYASELYYVCDFGRLFPCIQPIRLKQDKQKLLFGELRRPFYNSHLYHVFRSEFLKRNSELLSPDGFSLWGILDFRLDNGLIESATKYLETNVIQECCTDIWRIHKHLRDALWKSHSSLSALFSGHNIIRWIIVIMHFHGVNARYLGQLLQVLHSRVDYDTTDVCTLIFNEIIVRVVKSRVKRDIRIASHSGTALAISESIGKWRESLSLFASSSELWDWLSANCIEHSCFLRFQLGSLANSSLSSECKFFEGLVFDSDFFDERMGYIFGEAVNGQSFVQSDSIYLVQYQQAVELFTPLVRVTEPDKSKEQLLQSWVDCTEQYLLCLERKPDFSSALLHMSICLERIWFSLSDVCDQDELANRSIGLLLASENLMEKLVNLKVSYYMYNYALFLERHKKVYTNSTREVYGYHVESIKLFEEAVSSHARYVRGGAVSELGNMSDFAPAFSSR
jgi:hypothetical protein